MFQNNDQNKCWHTILTTESTYLFYDALHLVVVFRHDQQKCKAPPRGDHNNNQTWYAYLKCPYYGFLKWAFMQRVTGLSEWKQSFKSESDSCKVISLKKKETTESLKRVVFKTNPKPFNVDVNVETLAYCRSTPQPGQLDFSIGLNENANSFFAIKNSCFPRKRCTLKQHWAHKHCFKWNQPIGPITAD